MEAPQSVLVNFVYARPLGHAVEALRYCLGYHRADRRRRVGVVLNSHTATELAQLCPFVDATYAVPVDPLADREGDWAAPLAAVGAWDWVVDAPYAADSVQRAIYPGLARYYARAAQSVVARVGTGIAGATGPFYRGDQALRLMLSRPARDRAEVLLGCGRPRIAVLPAGGAARELYPSVASWRLVVGALTRRFPGATFCFLGKLKRDDRTSTAFERGEYRAISAGLPRSVISVDAPLPEQLAVVAACDLLVSPHSGFGMAAQAVGVPWLILAGNRWPEYLFNHVPFYSVLPDQEAFPCYHGLRPDPPWVSDDGDRSPSMSYLRFEADLAEIVEGAALLVGGALDYETAMRDHFERLRRRAGHALATLTSVDGVHSRHLSGGEP